MGKIVREDPSGLGYGEIARNLGLDRNTIMVMRCQQQPKFTYIKSLHPYFEKAFKQYENLQVTTVHKLQIMYYELEDEGLLYAFSKFLNAQGIYTSDRGWQNSARKYYFRFNGTKGIHHTALLRRVQVLSAYERFRL